MAGIKVGRLLLGVKVRALLAGLNVGALLLLSVTAGALPPGLKVRALLSVTAGALLLRAKVGPAVPGVMLGAAVSGIPTIRDTPGLGVYFAHRVSLVPVND